MQSVLHNISVLVLYTIATCRYCGTLTSMGTVGGGSLLQEATLGNRMQVCGGVWMRMLASRWTQDVDMLA